MYKREVPKLNKDNFASRRSRMRLYLSGIGDYALYYLDNQYTPPTPPMTIDQMKAKQEHNNLMIEIASSLNDVEFDDIKDCATTKEMWDKLVPFHGGDQNVLREKVESPRGKFNDTRMNGENIAQ